MHVRELPHTLDEEKPLIYMWEIRTAEGALLGRYVGKAKGGAKRPRAHYARNVANILSGKPYCKNNPAGYRRVHYALAEAQRNGLAITLQLLCNVQPGENINEVEQWHINNQNCRGAGSWQLNG
jgi:hypothetical protein